ncbi:MAG: glycosyltransferase [Ekhidna sp.]
MLILITIFTTLHALLYLWLFVSWNSITNSPESSNQNHFSIIIPVRNEAKNIINLLAYLEVQSFPISNFEVIVVNDFSEDGTEYSVLEYINQSTLNLKLLNLTDSKKQGKKHALTLGVKEARHPFVVTTDADCIIPKDWLFSFNETVDAETNMVAGPVGIIGDGIFARFQRAEFAGLIGFGAVTISRDSPAMCSGANLGFRKQVFEEVRGYEDNLFTPSGDDEFMLHSVMNKYPGSVKFLKDKRAVVETPAQSNWANLRNQRTRWTSKWKHNRNRGIQALAILFFLDYFLFYMMVTGLVMGWMLPSIVIGFVTVRFLADYIYLNSVNRFLGGQSIFLAVLFLQFLYPAHVLLMGVSSIFGKYTWKGRKY